MTREVAKIPGTITTGEQIPDLNASNFYFPDKPYFPLKQAFFNFCKIPESLEASISIS